MSDNLAKYKYRDSEKGKISAQRYKKNKRKRCRILDFHHFEQDKKSFQIGASYYMTFKAIIEEAKKCTILCSNCHRLVTWKNLDLGQCPRCKLNANSTS